MTNPEADAILHFSVGHGTDPDVRAGETVVVLPQAAVGEVTENAQSQRDRAFALARTLLARGARVRLVASGVTLPDTWPAWVGTEPGLVTTELGVYRLENPIAATRDLALKVKAWLDLVLGHLGDAASEMMYASLVNRALQPLFEATPYVNGLAAIHPDGQFVLLDSDWVGAALLRERVGESGGNVEPSCSASDMRKTVFVGQFLLRLCAAVAGQVRLYWQSGPSRRRLRRLRRSGSPRTWLALQPDWPRINRHLLAELGSTTPDHGILLTTTLQPGDVSNPDHAGPLWPGIPAELQAADASLVIDSIAGPTDLASLAITLARGTVASLRSGWRALLADPTLLRQAGGAGKPFLAQALARFLTTDVIQAEVGREMVRALAKHRKLAGSIVVFANLNVVDTAAAEKALRQQGAITIDFKHASGGGGWYGSQENFSDYIMIWGAADVFLTKLLARPTLLVAPPPAPDFHTRSALRRVLVLSAYSHEGWRDSGFPLRPLETELLRAVEMLKADDPDLAIRWRPHPSDDAQGVAQHLARFASVERSPNADLAHDLDWADVVITYGGTTLGQAVQSGKPVILHAAPSILTYPDYHVVSADRRFFYAADLPPLFERMKVAYRDGDRGIATDRRTFDALFAPPADARVVIDLDLDHLRPAAPASSDDTAVAPSR